jgi:hypothetical protein
MVYANQGNIPYPSLIYSLQQFPVETANQNLALVSEEVCFTLTDELGNYYYHFYYYCDARYTIKNNGSATQQTIGIAVFFEGNETFGVVPEFLVDGRIKEYRVEMIDDKYETPIGSLVDNSRFWLLIDVDFPENSSVTVQVKYRNCLRSAGDVEYKDVLAYGPDYTSPYTWDGDTLYTMTIENKSNNYFWITDIQFYDSKGILKEKKFREMGFLFTVIDEVTTSIQISRLRFSDKRYAYPVIIHLSSLYYGYTQEQLFFDFNIRNANGIPVSKKLLDKDTLLLFTGEQLRILRNIFYAQYGYKFTDPKLKGLFNGDKCLPYSQIQNVKGTIFNESLITDFERANIEIIKGMEALRHNGGVVYQ